MSTGTATRQGQQRSVDQVKPSQPMTIVGPRLAYHPLVQERFGVDQAGWRALVDAIFPTATTTESVILALSYCKARRLDPFKRVVHIVPIYSKAEGRMVDTVWPGIGELRTTAFRTGDYAGKDDTVYGPDITQSLGGVELTFPEWAQVTVYRIVKGHRVAFVGPKVRWLETYATAKRDTEAPNDMWRNRPYGQLEKCAEAAALRAGFPEEIGGDYIPEEVERGTHPKAMPIIEVAPTKSSRLAGELATRATESKPVAGEQLPEFVEMAPEAAKTVEPQSLVAKYQAAIAAADIDALANIRGDVATDDGLSAAEKTTLEVEIKARQDALKKK